MSWQRRQWQPTPVLLPGKSHGRRSLVGCSPWRRKESNTTERLPFHFSLSCIGEGNGNPLQYSCLENPRDSGAWWAAVYGVTQSRTRLKRLSSSGSWCPGVYGVLSEWAPWHLVLHRTRQVLRSCSLGCTQMAVTSSTQGFLGGSDSKESACQCGRARFDPCVWKILWRREWTT